jgi:transcriptional regulator with XRE-family HTH domain
MTLNSHIQNILKNSKKDTEWKKEAEERLQARGQSKKSGLIATQLAVYMAENGISQTALGKMTGVSPQQISKVLKGRENLTLATIEKIENALGIQLIHVNSLEEGEEKQVEVKSEREIKNVGERFSTRAISVKKS